MPTTYTLDLATGLTEVLGDGANGYLYGNGRTGEEQAAGWVYHLGDALGSVRQLVDTVGAVALAESYEPFGEALTSAGTRTSNFQFTGQQVDETGLVFLRARYYSGAFGRFLSRDAWEGNPNLPMSFNSWLYVSASPVGNVDPSGMVTWGIRGTTNWVHELIEASYERHYGSYRTHREFGSHLVGRSPVGAIDLIYFLNYSLQVGGAGFEFGWMTTGEVYEIEPITHAFSPGEGVDQAERYIRLLRKNASDLNGTVVDLGGTWNSQPFDWQYVQWDLGSAIGSDVRTIPLRGDRSILYWRQTPGLIVYVDTAQEDRVEAAMTAPMYERVREEFLRQAPRWVEREYRPSCFEVALDSLGDLIDRWAQYRAWAFQECHRATGQCETLPILP